MQKGHSSKNRIFARLSLFLVAVSMLIYMIPFFAWAEEEPAPTYIYFDLSAGSVTIAGNSYTGYRYDGADTATEITGTLAEGEAYYVYQSDGDINTGLIDGEMVLPTHDRVTYDGKLWGDYVTNNSDVEAVIKAWLESPENQTRIATPNRIAVSGKVGCTLVVDSIWSSYHVNGTSRKDGGISFNPSSTASILTVQTVGDNRVGNIYYYTGSTTTHRLIFEELVAGATLTVANLKSKDSTNHWNSAIGGSDSSDNTHGIVINSGTIWAGTNAADDCTAIGGGGNGVGVIDINGGRVTASVASSGAAIGGGIGKTSNGGAATVTITGGEVYAYNASCSSGSYSLQGVKYIPSAAIGGGSSARSTCSACTVTITGGKVVAQSVGGTAIGGGSSADSSGGTATIRITGGKVYAKSIAGYINGMDVPAGVAIGGGTGGKKGNGGSVNFTVAGDAVLHTGSIGGGSTIGDTSVYKIGSATIDIDGGTISGQFIMAEGSSTHCSFDMSGGMIDNGERDASYVFLQENGGAIYMDDSNGEAFLSGGTIQNCTAQNGGALYMTAGEFTLSGAGAIRDCAAVENGGAVYLGGGTLNIDGGAVTANEAQNGGGAYLADGEMYVTAGSIADNAATNNGGGAYLADGLMQVSGGAISANVATQNGGAFYLGDGDLTIGGSAVVAYNTAVNGGGAYVSHGTMHITGGELKINTATGDGGGAYVDGGDVYVSGGSVSSNTAANNGGGIAIHNGNYEMRGGEVSNNTATSGAGGALYISSDEANVLVTILSGTVAKNRAGTNGGALAVVGQKDATDRITVGLGVNHHHEGIGTSEVWCDHDGDTVDEINGCPIIKDNSSGSAGGALYISGTDDTVFNAYCLVETGSQAGEGYEQSHFMMVEGGKIVMSTAEENISTEGEVSTDGNIAITGSMHATGGKMEIHGSMSNPKIMAPITVDILDGDNHYFLDERVEDGSYYKLQYFENFMGAGTVPTGQYTIYQIAHGETYTIQGVIYNNPGYYIDGWYTDKLGEGDRYEINKAYTFTNEGPENPGSLILYGHWLRSGYTVIFKPNTDSYTGTMENQDFSYNVGGNLQPNGFGYPGYNFVEWRDVETGITYADEAYIYNLTDVNGKEFVFEAVWIVCTHTNGGDATYTYTAEGNRIVRECSCAGLLETLTVTAEDAVYNGSSHLATLTANGPWTVSDSDIVYTLGGVERTPINAGTYVASITVEGATATVTYLIDKAIPTNPNKPTFVDTDNDDGVTKSIVVTHSAEDLAGKSYQYRVSYFVGETPVPTDWQSGNTISLPVTYTNYVVFIRYAEDENYYASDEVRADYVFYYSAEVSISMDCCDGFLCLLEKIDGESGLKINLFVDDGYYKSAAAFQMYAETLDASGNSYADGAAVSADYAWLQNIPSDGTYTITLVVRGAKKIVVVSSTATEDEVFGTIKDDGVENKIAKDSAMTVSFAVENYYAYTDLRLDFGGASIPRGTTVIMIDKITGAYWYYVAATEATSVLLTEFTQMGGTATFAPPTAETLKYQFVIDFSKTENGIDGTALTVRLTATQDTVTDSAVPAFAENRTDFALETVDFAVEIVEQKQLEVTLRILFAQTEGVSSKWNDRVPVLILTPTSALPPEVALRVQEGEYTTVYSLVTDSSVLDHEAKQFIVPLRGVSEKIKLTLESNMFTVDGVDCAMNVTLGASASSVGSSSLNGETLATLTGGAAPIFSAEPTVGISLNVSSEDSLITAGDSSVLTVDLLYNIPDGYSIKAEIKMKNADGSYSGMGWSVKDIQEEDGFAPNEDGSGATYTLGLAAFQTSGSYLLELTVVNVQGVAVMSVPYYFVIYAMN